MQHPPSAQAEAPPRAALADVTNTYQQSTRWANMTKGQEKLLAEAGKRIKPLQLQPAPDLPQHTKGKPKAQPTPSYDIKVFGQITMR